MKTNKRVTAVEWLVKIYLQKGKIDSFDINQAKAMEKEQIINAHKQGQEFSLVMDMPDSEQCYTETFTETYGKSNS
jgi:hypothetical protein